jgi:probable rRNA maturation factor
MTNYQITLENDQNIVSLDEAEIITNSGFMLDYFFKNAQLLEKSVLDYCFNPGLTIGFDLYICDNAPIQQINNDYRQKNEPTDVISFALFADCKKEDRIIIDNQLNLGQIVISAERTIEQAQENEFLEEFYFLLAHGILHLLGFDHRDEDSLEFMLDIQKKMIESVKNVKI